MKWLGCRVLSLHLATILSLHLASYRERKDAARTPAWRLAQFCCALESRSSSFVSWSLARESWSRSCSAICMAWASFMTESGATSMARVSDEEKASAWARKRARKGGLAGDDLCWGARTGRQPKQRYLLPWMNERIRKRRVRGIRVHKQVNKSKTTSFVQMMLVSKMTCFTGMEGILCCWIAGAIS